MDLLDSSSGNAKISVHFKRQQIFHTLTNNADNNVSIFSWSKASLLLLLLLGRALDDFSDPEEEEDGQDVRFVNIPSLREQTSGTAKDAAKPKQLWVICADTVVSSNLCCRVQCVVHKNILT